MSAVLHDAVVLMIAVVTGWSIGLAMGMRDRPGKLDGPSATHPALDGPLGDISRREGKVVRR